MVEIQTEDTLPRISVKSHRIGQVMTVSKRQTKDGERSVKRMPPSRACRGASVSLRALATHHVLKLSGVGRRYRCSVRFKEKVMVKAIHIKQKLDNETLYLPQLPVAGRNAETSGNAKRSSGGRRCRPARFRAGLQIPSHRLRVLTSGSRTRDCARHAYLYLVGEWSRQPDARPPESDRCPYSIWISSQYHILLGSRQTGRKRQVDARSP